MKESLTDKTATQKRLLLIEPDNTISTILAKEVANDAVSVSVVHTAEQAIAASDDHAPDVVVTELALADHSAMGFLYEFRSYPEWQRIPVIVYSKHELTRAILGSRDWKLLNIYRYLYKPKVSLRQVTAAIHEAMQDT